VNVLEAYSRGSVPFMGIEVSVAPGALVPRPETELLGGAAVETIGRMERAAPRVIDMCCGAGNLACGIAHRLPAALVWASDLTHECAEIARGNVARLGLAGRVQVRQGDLFAALHGLGLEGTVDAVVCNPPYISCSRLEGDRAHLLEHEPRAAFDGGPYGLAVQQRVVNDAREFLRPGGVLLFEIGLGQERQMRQLFHRAGAYEEICLVADEAGNARVASGRRK
jgi:release factor glutamine methyltransferase